MPGCDAQRDNRIQLQWRGIDWGGVHHPHRFQSLRSALVENRSRLTVVDVLLLLTSIAGVGVVDLLSYPAGWEERLIAVAQRRRNVAVMGEHRIGGSEDFRGARCVTGRWIALQRHLHMPHLHRWHRCLVGLPAVVA